MPAKKPGLYANIHAKRKRGGKMRKPGSKGAPTDQAFVNAAKTAKKPTKVSPQLKRKAAAADARKKRGRKK